MDWIQSFLENSTTPFVTAFLLGILTAISPCPMATNITAIGFIGKECSNSRAIFWRGLLYTLGRIITYTTIGWILLPLLQEGASIYAIQKAIGHYGDLIIAPALILIGLFMLFGDRLNLPKFGWSGSTEKWQRGGNWGALFLGILFSLAFCPSSGVIYFGMFMPMAATASGAYLLPLVYAFATGLPVILVAWILAFSVAGIGKFYNRMQSFQKVMNCVIAALFIIVGIYYMII